MKKLMFLIFIIFPIYSFGQDWSFTTDSRNIKQGDVFIFRIQSLTGSTVVANNLRVRFLGRVFKVIGNGSHFISISAIPAAQPRQNAVMRGDDTRIRLRPGLYQAELLRRAVVVADINVRVGEGEFEEANYEVNYKGGSLIAEKLDKYRREVKAMNDSKALILNLSAGTGFNNPLDDIHVTSPFAKLRTYSNLSSGRAHAGVDLRAPIGTPVKAIGKGAVEYIGINHVFEGTVIIINHGGAVSSRFEGIRSYYLHLSEVLVRRGEEVKKGQLIAKSGDSAVEGNPHLHMAVKINDIYVDFQKLRDKF